MFDLKALMTRAEGRFAALKFELIRVRWKGVTIDINAVVIDLPPVAEEAAEMTVREERVVMQFTAADLMFGSSLVMPERGMEFRRNFRGTTQTYLIVTSGQPAQHYEWLGVTRQRIQVNGTLIASQFGTWPSGE